MAGGVSSARYQILSSSACARNLIRNLACDHIFLVFLPFAYHVVDERAHGEPTFAYVGAGMHKLLRHCRTAPKNLSASP